MDQKTAFAARLMAVLDENDYPPKFQGRQQKLAKEMAVSTKTISNWLQGLKLPTEHHIYLLCQRFNLSRDWLMTGMGMKHPITEREQELINSIRDLSPGEREMLYRAAKATASTTERAA
jgi:transcriptional regulator with XRE-family HTH domain